MHFCPRVNCRQWYHGNCLNDNGHISEKSLDERAQELLDIPQARIHSVPPKLLRLACEPIIRGHTHGIVGNVKAVCEAREWAQLCAATPLSENRSGLVLNGITLDRWLDSLEGNEVEEELIYICPVCKTPV